MPRFAYAWHAVTDAWRLRAVIAPDGVPPDGLVILTEEQAAHALRVLEEECPPPWWVVGEMIATSWDEVDHRVRAWHFT